MHHELTLSRPLVFFDLEATGPDRTKDKIIQFCFVTYHVDGTVDVYTRLVKPCISVTHSAMIVHGITDDQLKDCMEFKEYAQAVYYRVSNADLVGYGCLQFDVPLLFQELNDCGITWDYTKCNIVDTCNIYKRQVPRDLSAAFNHYMGKSFDNAHDAEADVMATRDVFFAQVFNSVLPFNASVLAQYSNYDKPLVDLCGKFTVDEAGEYIINFSSNKGQKAKDNLSFIYWMLDKDFTEDVKIICRKIVSQGAPVTNDFAYDDAMPF